MSGTSMDPMAERDRVLAFWYEGVARRTSAMRPAWFKKDDGFDAACRAGFLHAHEAAAAGALDVLMADGPGCLALCILLDQLPRNMFRGEARAFATDARALSVAAHCVGSGFDRAMGLNERLFLYLPFEHAEDMALQDRSVDLIAALGDADLTDYAIRHRDIIVRFGRFPHRNAILGRASTAEEEAFLKEPGSGF